ncbi:MAG: hypothetical protein AB1810_14040 [Pseudomonadota bacterium]
MTDKSTLQTQAEDMTGRDKFAWNVITSWGSYLVFFVAGFIVPRMIDDYAGQVSLGIWDFCWSFINYISLSNLGIGTAINRYVAVHRASGQLEELSKIVSSTVFIQIGIAAVVLLATAAVAWSLPVFFVEKLGSELNTAVWVVILLGAALAVEMAVNWARGVITGCHRWDLNSGLNAAGRFLAVVGMVAVLVAGGGLIGLGVVYLVVTVLTELVRIMIARRICPELVIGYQFISRAHGLEAFQFGGKAMIFSLPALMLVQTTNILLVAKLGPAALAVFSRPVALVRHMEGFLSRFSMILTPTAGVLHQAGSAAELREFLLTSTKYGVAFTLPIVLLLVCFGDVVLDLWMGPEYANWWLMTIFALGYFLPVSQGSVYRVLMGMGHHGKVAVLSLLLSIATFIAGALLIDRLGWDLIGAALLVTVPLTLSNGILLPIFACRKLEIPLHNYLGQVFLRPIALNAVFFLVLVACRWFFGDTPLLGLLIACVTGGAVLAVMYWWYLVPAQVRYDWRNTAIAKRLGL